MSIANPPEIPFRLEAGSGCVRRPYVRRHLKRGGASPAPYSAAWWISLPTEIPPERRDPRESFRLDADTDHEPGEPVVSPAEVAFNLAVVRIEKQDHEPIADDPRPRFRARTQNLTP